MNGTLIDMENRANQLQAFSQGFKEKVQVLTEKVREFDQLANEMAVMAGNNKS